MTSTPPDGEELTVAALLRQAMQRRATELGGTYSYRDLQRDSSIHFSYLNRIARGGFRPSRKILVRLHQALGEYFPLEEAMVASGYVPPREAGRYRELLDLERQRDALR